MRGKQGVLTREASRGSRQGKPWLACKMQSAGREVRRGRQGIGDRAADGIRMRSSHEDGVWGWAGH